MVQCCLSDFEQTRKKDPVETTITVGDAELEVTCATDQGLHCYCWKARISWSENCLLVQKLAAQFEVIIPSPPGFGKSNRPDWITSPDDISYLYNDLLRLLDLRDVHLVGFSLGGWLSCRNGD